jgi:hypothetical protein
LHAHALTVVIVSLLHAVEFAAASSSGDSLRP